MGPPPGGWVVGDEGLGLEMRAGDIGPWIMTWRDLFGLVELVRYCFVDKRVFYAFEANVWIGDVFRAIIDVGPWRVIFGT